ncbi:uncharacterized protein NECHADRAFT_34651 [Fusarium vanettenii 77-13-4]|uniref:Uncharacterized protein n=1 Tax=Fusarium vanettenii (strain ATCC MYA-4622 / CBS 123669 / FGSC 9596 / NRRL 45880 / 77-13-4) TaxID=660122 RepID=C7ZCN6_FUSV7|nr:uncharacterized protein NECHADRAFT_34651 [Fusarium vanettenii 77-13-4]EEU38401.1 hypothetical protein NECHADRAFT_34651 [Fusarium vanettenii 77-13-4]
MVTIPCREIRLGNFLMLQGRPCWVKRIDNTPSATGQYRYAGVDLFTKQPHEQSSITSKPAPGVVVPIMYGPVFHQYRILDIQEGQILAMDETGSRRADLPVFDHFNLHTRLRNAFKFSHGLVRALVLRYGDEELAVDMKIVSGTGQPVGEDNFQLHVAARKGQEWKVRKLLENEAIVKGLDPFNGTALFGALENHYDTVARLLIDADIDLNVVDKFGRTALDIATSNPEPQSMVDLLLEKGVSPIEGVRPSVLDLLLASARGDTSTVHDLLSSDISDSVADNVQRVDPNERDRLGYTALHEAACFANCQIASMLIEHKANVDAVITSSGDTVLHAVIERGRKHRRFLPQSRQQTPPLREDHVQVVKLLLEQGASTKRRRKDGRTVQDLVSLELMSPDLTNTEQRILQHILVLLSSSTAVKEAAEREPEPREAGVDGGTIELCNYFKLQLQCHYSRRDPEVREVPIGNFLYSQTANDFGLRVIQELEGWATGQSVEDCWRWVHLPVNNKVWVEDIIGLLSGMKGAILRAYSDAMATFVGGSYHEVRGPAPHARLRRPSFTPYLGSHGGIFSLAVDPKCRENFLNMNKLGEKYNTPDGSPGNLHVPFTLDQSYYLSLTDSTYRDKDQVVAKYADRRKNKNKSLLMVNQMWVWKIDAKTVITALPDRRHPIKEQSTFVARICKIMEQDRPLSLDSMFLQMMKCAFDLVDAPPIAGLNENVLDIFEQSIAHWAHQEAHCYEEFHGKQEAWRDSTQPKNCSREARGKDEKNMCDIGKEVGYIREIKDIQDELRMIERVLEDQRTVVDQYEAGRRNLPFSEKGTLDDLKQSILFRISKIQKLSRDASSVENSLNHLLDIKQKQANLNTPVSFVCTFLAVPTLEFPRGNGDGDVAWGWWQVFVGACESNYVLCRLLLTQPLLVVTEMATFVAIGMCWVVRPDEDGNLHLRKRKDWRQDEECQRPQARTD